MENILSLIKTKEGIKSIFLDLTAVSFIYFVPAISHMFSIPFYLLEPMRIMLILALAHSGKLNSFLIAFSLPLFSFLVSNHPSIEKSILLTSELAMNVWLFYEFSKKFNGFFSALLAISIGKVFYYGLKYTFILLGLLEPGLITTPVYLQIITMFILSGYVYLIGAVKLKRGGK
ncbi:MAG: hypothetical protein HF314_03785 [Ignavibacteria bacterium]|nr:hypothetical protein [Ignavibacteria bacterium]MCU7502172.1 hypothetical protein [Ignavibacteria bacterium]MCU7517389.1 hypothetical protein [Ignavibacteria bacterium]